MLSLYVKDMTLAFEKKIAGHVRRAHGAFVRPHIFTVAILAQGTNRGDALCAALLLNHIVSILLHRMF